MTRILAVALVAGLGFTGAAQALDLTNMSDDERTVFGAEVRAYLMENPQVIIDAVNTLEARQAEARAADDDALVAANADALFGDGFSWEGGNLNGDVTIVEFVDYRCGYCRKAHAEVEQLLASDGNIKLIMKELPILGDASVLSSRFAVAVKQTLGGDAYKMVHDALITFKGEITPGSLRRLAETMDLDADAILAHMDTDEVTAEIAETRALAQRMQINGTPSFVMGDQMVRGYVPLDGMRQIVAELRG